MSCLKRCSSHQVNKEQDPSYLKNVTLQFYNAITRSSLDCTHTVKGGIVHRVKCKNEQAFDWNPLNLVNPFAKPKHVAIHSSKLSLELKRVEPGFVVQQRSDPSNWVRQDLTLGLQGEATKIKPTSEAEVRQVLVQLCNYISDKTAHLESSSTFAKLVDLLRHLPVDATSNLYGSIKSADVCPSAPKRLRDLFHDASAFAATESSIVNLAKAYSDKQFSNSRATGYFTILALKTVPKNGNSQNINPYFEISIRQQGLSKMIARLIELFSEEILTSQFDSELEKDFMELLAKLQSSGDAHSKPLQLQIGIKLMGQNVFFIDMIEDLAAFVEWASHMEQLELAHYKEDSILGAVLFDNLDYTVSTATGIPVHYKLNLNSLDQSNSQENHLEPSKSHFIINHSLVVGVSGSVRLQLAGQKVGYEYNGRLALTPNLDVELENTSETDVSMKWNLNEDKQTFLKMTQSVKELKQIGSGEQTEVELAPKSRHDQCASWLILNYCRKMSRVSSPYVEYYITKPESNITALKFDLKVDAKDENSQSFTVKANVLGTTAKDYEHLVRIHFHDLPDAPARVGLKLKSPGRSYETEFSISTDNNTKVYNVKLDSAKFKLDGKFVRDSGNTTTDVLIQYADERDMQFVKFQNNFDYGQSNFSWSIETSQLPWLNHRAVLKTVSNLNEPPQFVNKGGLIELAYGPTMENVYRFEGKREGNITDPTEPKVIMNMTDQVKFVATPFGLNYGFKTDARFLVEKEGFFDAVYNITGTDYSKQIAGEEQLHSDIHFQNKGESLDSMLDSIVTYKGEKMAFHGELKKVRPKKYEGKFSLEL